MSTRRPQNSTEVACPAGKRVKFGEIGENRRKMVKNDDSFFFCTGSNWFGNVIPDVYEGIRGDLSLFGGDLLLGCVASEHRNSAKFRENCQSRRENRPK